MNDDHLKTLAQVRAFIDGYSGDSLLIGYSGDSLLIGIGVFGGQFTYFISGDGLLNCISRNSLPG